MPLATNHDLFIQSYETHYTSLIRSGCCRIFFYQKKESYLRLQMIAEDFYWERYIPWGEWDEICSHLEKQFSSSVLPIKSITKAFADFCDGVHLPAEWQNYRHIQVFTHGNLPLWVFPAHESNTIWEFFLPVSKRKTLSATRDTLIIYDDTLVSGNKEKETLSSLLPNPESVLLSFASSVLWENTYRTLHIIAHGKKGTLLSPPPLLTLPVLTAELAFFHCCEAAFSSQSIVSSTLSRGTQYCIAPCETIPDDENLLDGITFFYTALKKIPPLEAFHITSLGFPSIKRFFRFFLSYERHYQ